MGFNSGFKGLIGYIS